MKRKSGFTLVEMLIVVVIIGILSAALIPRLTGYMARTRDLKRHADLRNIAAAITMYKNDHGEFPFPYDKNGNQIGDKYDNHAGVASEFSLPLQDYLSSIPQDPSKRNRVAIHTHPQEGELIAKRIKSGEYVYQYGRKGKTQYGILGLVVKVETPEYANYVLTKERGGHLFCHGCGWTIFYGLSSSNTISTPPDLERLNLCESIEKVKKGEESHATDTNKKCTFSSEDQLYYIVKIE